MPYEANITDALKLVRPNIVTNNTYSYFFATAMPNSWPSGNYNGLSTSRETFVQYVFNPTHFVPVGAGVPDLFANAFLMVQNLTSLSFTPGEGVVDADILVGGLSRRLYSDDLAIDGYQGGAVRGFTFSPPLTGTVPGSLDEQRASDIIILPSAYQTPERLARNVVHELNHALGLMDTGEATLTGEADTGRYTIMSSELHPEEGRRVTELQLYDIAALQSVYGRDDTYNADDTVVNTFTELSGADAGKDRIYSIWDGGGKDTIDASGLLTAALIDLRPGHFSSVGPGSTVVVKTGAAPKVSDDGPLNISIAFGAYIEDATGTAANDVIIGNILSNKIIGGDGDDIIYGEGYNLLSSLKIMSGNGDYSVIGVGGRADPPSAINDFVIDPTRQRDVLEGGKGNDFIVGSRGGDVIRGGANADRLFGGGSNVGDSDDFVGGGGNDFIDATGGTAARVLWSKGDGFDTIRADYGGVDLAQLTLQNFEEVLYNLPDPRGIWNVDFRDLLISEAELVLRNLQLIDHVVEDGLNRYLYVSEVWILQKGTNQGVNLGLSVSRTIENPLEVNQTYLNIEFLPTIEFRDGRLSLSEGGPNISFRIDSGSSAAASFAGDAFAEEELSSIAFQNSLDEANNFDGLNALERIDLTFSEDIGLSAHWNWHSAYELSPFL